MAKQNIPNVTMRVRIGENEIEVTGPSNYVEKKIDEFINNKNIKTQDIRNNRSGQKSESKAENQIQKKKLSLSQLFRKISPKTDTDRVLIAGYYLEKYQNEETFSSAEIREIIRKAKVNPPKNPTDAINKNIRKGFIMSAGDKDGKRAFVLTTDGEDMINEMLSE